MKQTHEKAFYFLIVTVLCVLAPVFGAPYYVLSLPIVMGFVGWLLA